MHDAGFPGPLIMEYEGHVPVIHPTAFIAPGAIIIGDVEVGADSGIWYNCVLRGDVNEIRIGARTNLQDGTVVHVSSKGQGTYIGDDVSIGHKALIHACTVGDAAFIGMNACVMDDCIVEKGAMVAAGALVTPGKTIASGELWAGSPAKLLRPLGEADSRMMTWTAPHYVSLAKKHTRANKEHEEK